jgi:hypothetical protein
VIVDTDVLVWVLRGHEKAAKAVDETEARAISVVTYMELLQGARDKREVRAIKSFLVDLQFRLLPLTENVGHRASIYMEEYGLSVGMSMADALLAATAVESGEPLRTANQKHYRPVKELEVRIFRPGT